MEGLALAVIGFVIGWIASYKYWSIEIRSDESARVMSRVLTLESELRFTRAQADGYRHDIERMYEKRKPKTHEPSAESIERAVANGWGYVLGLESPSGQSLNQDKKDQK